jgi:hypothetical protein
VKTVLIVVGVGVGIFMLYRVASAAAAGAPIGAAVRSPRVPVDVLAAKARVERQTNTGAGHF